MLAGVIMSEERPILGFKPQYANLNQSSSLLKALSFDSAQAQAG
jgi:hypothetical protein